MAEDEGVVPELPPVLHPAALPAAVLVRFIFQVIRLLQVAPLLISVNVSPADRVTEAWPSISSPFAVSALIVRV